MNGVLDELREAGYVAVLTHQSPDGDALGSALALRRALLALGKRARAFCPDAAPPMFAFLPDVDLLETPNAAHGEVFDLAVLVDVSDPARAEAEELFAAAKRRAVIDHHVVEPPEYPHYLNAEAAACGELVLEAARGLGVPMDTAMAELLYVAMSDDTGHFSFSNTTPATMRAAADMMEAGANASRVTGRLYRTRTRARTMLLGRALNGMRLHAGGRVAELTLSYEDFTDCGAGEHDTEGIVNYGIEVEGVSAAFLARETETGIRMSLRTNETVDARAVCARFGGGGHTRAAGCTLQGALGEAAGIFVKALTEALGSPGEK